MSVLDRLPDGTAALLAEGYRWGSRACDARGADVAPTRLLLRRAVVVRGPENARHFYSDAMVRAGAAPRRLQRTLFGVGGVQGLDGAEHRHRKAMFLELLGPARADALAAVFVRRWRDRLPDWECHRDLRLVDEVGELLCAAVCDWAGVPLPDGDVRARRAELEALIEGGAKVGPGYLRGVLARRRLERWLAVMVSEVRSRRLQPPAGSALDVVARHRGLDGHLLAPRVAAVELLNVLRPTVAIDRFVVWAALALHEHPQWRARLAGGDDEAVPRFVLEVRRLAPFFPLATARTRCPVTLGQVTVPAGTRVLLDLFGTDHDPRSWADPDTFDPDRFAGPEPDLYQLVPQGGGDHATGHRCAGEWVTTAVLQAAVRFLTREVDYRVPDQDLSADLRRMPALPASGFVVSDVRSRARVGGDPGG
jgi:fatty-acid peroxygenase